MRYISTRGGAEPVSFFDAVLAGLAPDGGLYVPEDWPQELAREGMRRGLGKGHFTYAAANVLKVFAGDELKMFEASTLATEAYVGLEERKWPNAVVPLVQIGGGEWLLELFHGPSLAFKDVAMQLIGPLYDFALERRDRRLTVVCATSGDTGGAAVEALKNRERMDLFVLTPKGRVSEVQRRFMTASGADNVHTLEVDGDFDACQAIVKALFADREFTARASLSGVNSINFARILAQSTYFHLAANALCGSGPVQFAVPTGNFGDAYSAYVAKVMGAPIGKILIAVNANDILARMLETGRYERGGPSKATLSPAMDIQVASNFERILFDAVARDGAEVSRLYAQFAQSGGFDLPERALAFLRETFVATSVDDAQTQRAMRGVWDEGRGQLICPHTAVATFARVRQGPLMDQPMVTLATAHPAKFPDAVEEATGVRPALPAQHADLFSRSERVDPIGDDSEAVKAFIRARSRAWA